MVHLANQENRPIVVLIPFDIVAREEGMRCSKHSCMKFIIIVSISLHSSGEHRHHRMHRSNERPLHHSSDRKLHSSGERRLHTSGDKKRVKKIKKLMKIILNFNIFVCYSCIEVRADRRCAMDRQRSCNGCARAGSFQCQCRRRHKPHRRCQHAAPYPRPNNWVCCWM